MYDMSPYLRRIERVIENGPFHDNWDSLQAFHPPKWWQRAKFGIFIHWGVYSVPAYGNEWYARNMYIQGSDEYAHHRKTWGPQDRFGYKDFIPLFRAENFDPEEWTELFVESGARYVVPVAEHHDGFQMYRSEISHWNAAEMGPHRDVLGELQQCIVQSGLHFCASSHRIEHSFFMSHGREFDSDVREPLRRGDLYWPAMPETDREDPRSKPDASEEFLQDWLVRTCELIDRYQPDLLYFDWWIQHSCAKPWLKKLAAYYYNRAQERGARVGITYKQDAFPFACGAIPDVERGQFSDMQGYAWQTDTSIALNSWGYTRDNRYRSAPSLVRDLVDIVSKNGCLLLNIGPRADGVIPQPEQEVLRQIGAWLRVNGEAIYGSRVWRIYGEGPTQVPKGGFTDAQEKPFTHEDIRFTCHNGCLYAIALKQSPDGSYCIHALAQGEPHAALFTGLLRDVRVLGTDEPPQWRRDQEGLHLYTDVKSDYPIVFKLLLD